MGAWSSALFLVLFVPAAAVAAASGFPEKPVRLIVPYASGGPTDMVARLLADGLADVWKQRVLVENKPGASGVIGAQALMASESDGHTLMLHATSGLTIYPALAKKPTYDPLRDFTPISPTTFSDLILVVSPTLPVTSVKELIEFVAASTAPVTYASAGPGALNHIGGELFKMLTGSNITHVPYKGDAPAVIDLVGGNVTMSFLSANLAIPQIKAGKLKGIAVTGRARSAAVPELPTMIEAGLDEFDLRAWNGVVGPAGMKQEVVATINQRLSEVLHQPRIRQRLVDAGLVPDRSSPEEFAARIAAELKRWRAVGRNAGISLD